MSFVTLIDVQALAKLQRTGAVRLFDCGFDLGDPAGGHGAYLAGHLPGAHYLHLDDDLSSPAGESGRHPLPEPEVLAEKLRAAGVNRDDQIVAYDSSGGPFAARLWWLLGWLGHDRVAVLDGGKQAWADAGLPLETGAAKDAASGNWTPAIPRTDAIVSADDVLANIAIGDFLVIDARSEARWSGEPHPLDAISGHIPGARSRFYGDNLTAEGRFKSPDLLRSEFAAVLDGKDPADAVLQCGSGVTACHDLLALAAAGLPGARLYPGSWSEWTNDPTRPVERAI